MAKKKQGKPGIKLIFKNKDDYAEFDAAVYKNNSLLDIRYIDQDKDKLEYGVYSTFLDHQEILSSLERYKLAYNFEIVIS